MVIITLYNSKILLSLHYFLTPQFQTFTNLLFRIFGVSNPTFLSFLRNYASIIINVISNNTVLQCYLLWIFVSIRKLLQLIVCVGVSTPSYLKNMTPFFKIFLSLTPSHLLKVTKFLVEIFQFKFLVMTERNIFI